MSVRFAVKATLAWMILCLLPGVLTASPRDGVVSIPMPDGARFDFPLPAGWDLAQSSTASSLTLRVTPGKDGDAVVLLTVTLTASEKPATSRNELRLAAAERGEVALRSATQEKLEILEYESSDVFLCLYHLTDRQPERGAGDYREVDQGLALIRGYVGAVTILTHTGDQHLAEKGRKAILTSTIRRYDRPD